MRLTIRMILTAQLTGIVLAGCAGAPKSEYTAFAQAGAGYAAAVDKLLTSAGIAQIDSTSWTLVTEKNSSGMDDRTYTAKTKVDRERLIEISRLRVHAKLLAKYFSYLESLATSEAPDKTKAAIEGVIANINKLGLALPSSKAALPAFGQLAVDLKIRAALREELEKRKDVIRKELQVQEELLQELTGDISHALKLEQDAKEQQLVIIPIMSNLPLKDAKGWVATRREVLYMPITVEEVASAGDAARKMREAFEGLLSGEDSIGHINALIIDVESIYNVIDALNS